MVWNNKTKGAGMDKRDKEEPDEYVIDMGDIFEDQPVMDMDELGILEDRSFDPTNIVQFMGYRFMTQNCIYAVDIEGMMQTRPKVDLMQGAELNMLAAMRKEDIDYLNRAYRVLPPDTTLIQAKHYLEKMIMDYGVMPEPGLILVMTMADDQTMLAKRNGGYTSILEQVLAP